MTDLPDQYEHKHQIRFVDKLGDGKDGLVLKTDRGHAVKFLLDRDVYSRELRAYRVLQQQNIDEILGHQVPRLIRHDDDMLTIEMTIVKPPFLLDFASAYTKQEWARLAFTPEVLQERQEHWSEIFGDKWRNVAPPPCLFAANWLDPARP